MNSQRPPANGRSQQDQPPPAGSRPFIPQVDGMNDDEPLDDEIDKNAKAADELGSDLDESEDDIDQNQDIDDLLLCLYEKVHRSRNKWKCNFKSGIFHVNGSDYAFNRLNGDFEW